jgi:hypothetical protein
MPPQEAPAVVPDKLTYGQCSTIRGSGMLRAFLHRAARDWVDGLCAGLDVLLWGQAYPRRVSVQDLQRGQRRASL